jgi:hypothetical protein
MSDKADTPVVALMCKAAYVTVVGQGEEPPHPAVAWSYTFTLCLPDGEGGYRQVQPRRRIGIMADAGRYVVDRVYVLTPAPVAPDSPAEAPEQ